jgi:hypothetical protein
MVLGASPNVFVVPEKSEIKTMKEFIEKAKANGGTFNWTSPGAGTTPQLAGELIKLRTGIQMQHIPFPGAGPATNAVLAGTVDLYTANIGSVQGLIDGGKVRHRRQADAFGTILGKQVGGCFQDGLARGGGVTNPALHSCIHAQRLPCPGQDHKAFSNIRQC